MQLFIKRVLSHLPSRLPVGMTEFYKFADDIIELSGPYADVDSMRFAIASAIIHLPHTRGLCTKNFFVQTMRKSAANQVASQVFQDIKQKQADQQLHKQQQEALLNNVNKVAQENKDN